VTRAPPPLLLFIGAAFLLGGTVLAWLASPATLQIVRTDATTARAEIEDRLFGLIPTASIRVEGVRAAEMVSGRVPESQSRSTTPPRLIFVTTAGRIDPGHALKRFTRRYTDIQDFLADGSAREFTASSLIDGAETRRFWFAHLAAAFLAGIGLLVLWAGFRALFSDPYAGVGPR
jgi:hypothetical protein